MTTRTDVLEDCLAGLNLNMPTCSLDTSQALANPLDLYRSYLATILAALVDCNDEDAFKSIQWPNNIFNGDLAVVLPKLQPGAKADKLAVALLQKVLVLCEVAIPQ
jgi:arginyl-tRNA synthetase